MDLNQVFAVLQQADQQAQKTNPYGGFENISDQLGGVITKAAGTGQYGFGEILGASLLDGLMGGVAQNYGNEYRADQNKMAMDSLANIWKGGDAMKPDGMNNNVWSSISGPGQLFKAQRDMENQQLGLKADLELRNDVKKAMITEAVKNPYSPTSQKILQGLGISSDAPAQPAPEATPMVSGPGMSPGSENFAADPLDLSKFSNAATAGNMIADNVAASASKPAAPKTMQDYLVQYQGNQAVAEAAMKRDLEAPDRVRDGEDKLRQQFQQTKIVQDFGEISKQYAVMQKAEKDPASVSDLDFTIGSMKILDPTSIVRESEQGMVFDSQSVPSRLLGQINQVVSGQAKLTPTLRKEILDLAQRRYEVQQEAVKMVSDEYNRMATDRGIDPNKVTFVPQASVAQRQKADTSAGATAPNTSAAPRSIVNVAPNVKLVDGVEFQRTNGQWVKKTR